MHNKFKYVFFLTLCIIIAMVACRHHPDFSMVNKPVETIVPTPWQNPDSCHPDSVYFTNTIAPILNAYCGSEDCHDAVDPQKDIDVTSYGSIMNSDEGEFVAAGNLGDSKLYEAIMLADINDEDHMPPAESTQLNSEQIALLTQWILQGAINNSCIADCDTSLASTYNAVVMPIIQNNCIGCHGTTNPSGNISFTSHAQVAAAAADGSLMGCLTGSYPYPIMPENTYGLPQCMIDQIQEWIVAGMPNN